ncbi:MAG: SpoIIE family protein phosphatase [Deltaproteobacteria bacterium]|jgi:serine phosphatase RsbU (regulator of sigma subunit)|nr:SpoIIE family protein phosphatase [Deltaproteobacteria bacterium]
MMSRLFKAIILGVFIGIAGLLISPFRFALDVEENTGLGLLFRLRGARPAPPEVFVVSIEKESSEYLGLPNNPDKWPRSLHARLIENLVREGAAVISFDLHFIEPRVAADDTLFAEAIEMAHKVVLAEPLIAKELPAAGEDASAAGVHQIVKTVKPIDLFTRAAVATAPFSLPRIPFKVNRYWTFQTGAGESPTLPVVAFQLFTLPAYEKFSRLIEKVSPRQTAKLPVDIHAAVQTGSIKRVMRDIREIFASDPFLAEKMRATLEHSSFDRETQRLLKALVNMYAASNRRYLNYYGPPRTMTTIPFHEALQIRDGKVKNKPLNLKGKAVFVGLSEVLLADRKDSFYTVFSQANGIFISGVEIAATAFGNILEDSPVRPIRLGLHIAVIFLWGLLMGVVCRISALKIGALGAVVLSVVYLLSAVYLFERNGSWYPIIIPLGIQMPLAFIGAVAFEHSRLFKEALVKLRMERDLSRARDVQTGMLPSTCPKIEGYQIAASSTPAREVGGDFYDFIVMGNHKTGVIIGDVTGKSVSGALIMSASRSVFRILSEEGLTVRESMMRANLRLKEDVTSGMFVALIFAVLNSATRKLTLCNAGQTQPIHYSAETAQARLVVTEGDTFPLGIMEKARYRETELQLAPGDRLLFYTDGIVEAMNAKKKIFGFRRLLDAVQQSNDMDAESLLKEIISRVNAFVGHAAQHDDLTMIIIGVDKRPI